MSLEQRKALYKKTSMELADREFLKYRIDTNDYFCRNEERLLFLIKNIPNWETYLTDKQLQVVRLYIGCRNSYGIDVQLHLGDGVAYHTLFGSNKKGQPITGGVLKKLERVYQVLQQIKTRRINNVDSR